MTRAEEYNMDQKYSLGWCVPQPTLSNKDQ